MLLIVLTVCFSMQISTFSSAWKASVSRCLICLKELKKIDQRHQEIIEFGVHPISEQNFDGWAMKFVRRNSEVSEFFQKLGHLHFSPTKLNQQNLNDFLHILTKARQETQA